MIIYFQVECNFYGINNNFEDFSTKRLNEKLEKT